MYLDNILDPTPGGESFFSEPLLENQNVSFQQRSSIRQVPIDFGAYSTRLKKGLVEQMRYGDMDLLQQPNNFNSEEFLKEVTYRVNLSLLYKIVDSCYLNDSMPYCPILVQVGVKNGQYTCKYLLQVWNKYGEIIFEKQLQDVVICWYVTFDTFIYQVGGEDEANSGYINIVYLEKQNSELKIKILFEDYFGLTDEGKMYFGYCNKCLYISKDTKIVIFNVNFALQIGQTTVVENVIQNGQPFLIQLKTKIHGFITNSKSRETRDQCIIVCSETTCNQIDFQRLYYHVNENRYKFIQQQEVIKKEKYKYDPIVEFKAVQSEDNFAVALRESGNVDIYWHYMRVSSTDDQQQAETFDDVEVTFDAIFLKPAKTEANVREIKKQWGTRMGLEVSEIADRNLQQNSHSINSSINFQKLFYHNVRNHVNFYRTFCLIHTSYIVAHSDKIFIFDILLGEWKDSFTCSAKVLKVFRNLKSQGEYNVGILLVTGQFLILDLSRNATSYEQKWEEQSDLPYKVPGQAFQYVIDNQYFKMLYILSKEDDKFHLTGFTKKKLYKMATVSASLGMVRTNIVDDLNENSKIIPLFQSGPQSHFVVFNESLKDDGFSTLQIGHHFYKTINQVEQLVLKKVKRIDNVMAIDIEPDDYIHAALSIDIDTAIILVSNQNLYIVNMVSGDVETINNANITGLQIIDNKYCYATVCGEQTKSTKRCGLNLFCIDQVLKDKYVIFYPIINTIAGLNSFVDFSQDNQRLSCLNSYDQADIIPPLHRSTINFIGMSPRDIYLAVKKDQNKFYALDNQNRITVWNAITGKFIACSKLINKDYSDYEIYSYEDKDLTYKREWYQPRTLIRCKSEERYSADQFYQASQLQCDINGSVAYVMEENKKFHQFKYIEIIDEKTVKEHVSFIHPFYNKFQRIYISSDTEHMIERLSNLRVIVYQRNQLPNSEQSKWIQKKRLFNFPNDLSDISYNLYLFSPDLQNYLDYDIQKGKFIIKSTLIDRIIEIPTYLMDPVNEDPEIVAKRFTWTANDRILICSKWGFEKLIQINELPKVNGGVEYRLDEISSGSIPAFSQADYNNHLYVEQPSLELGDVYNRLRRKQQQMKRKRFILQGTGNIELFDTLFSIDYNVASGWQKYVSDISFSHFHWQLIENLAKKKINIESIDQETLEMMCLNILPGVSSVFHEIYNHSNDLIAIFNRVPMVNALKNFELPFTMNMEDKTPLHLCQESQNYKSADIFIKHLTIAPIDHHAKLIVNVLPFLIAKELPSLLIYFEKRLIQTDQLKQINRGALKLNIENNVSSIIASDPWADPEVIKNQMMRTQATQNVKIIENDINLRLLDLPQYCCYNCPNSQVFFQALNDSEQMELFGLESIRNMIDFMWPLAKKYTIYKLLIPFLFYLLTYWFYTNYEFDDMKNQRKITIEGGIVLALLLLFSLYFLTNEAFQSRYQGMSYFQSPWNYIDFIPPVIIIWLVIVDTLFPADDFVWENPLQAIGSLFMWVKLLYFLRINNYTGHLIRMIVKVIAGMKTFLMVMLIAIAAFADANQRISIQDPQNNSNFVSKFLSSCYNTYQTILGNGKDELIEPEHEVAGEVFNILCTLLAMIVMLNLLISIIGDTFGEVQQNAQKELYSGKASIISENLYLIPQYARDNHSKTDQYLLIGNKVNTQGDLITSEFDDNALGGPRNDLSGVADMINQLKDQIFAKIDTLETKINNINSRSEYGARMTISQRNGYQDGDQNFGRSQINQ